MNCHECKHVGTVVGSRHSSCGVLNTLKDSVLAELLVAAGVASIKYTKDGEEKDCVEIDEHGKKNGWAMWPMNFDPCWINSCIFFTKK